MKNTINWIFKKIYKIDIDNLKLQNASLSKENGLYISNNRELERKNNIYIETINSLKKEKTYLQNINLELSDKVHFNEKRCKELLEKIDSLGSNLKSKKEFIKDLKSQIDNKNAIISEKDEQIKKIESKILQLDKTDKDDLTANNEQEKDHIENLNRQYQNLKELYNQICKDNSNYKAKINTKDSTIEILNKELTELQNENSNLKNQIISERIIEEENKNKIYTIEDNSVSSTYKVEDAEKKDHFLIDTEEKSKTIEVKQGTLIVADIPQLNISSNHYNTDTKRNIDTVIDIETGEEIKASTFFSQSENIIFKTRTELEKAIYLKKPKYVCKYCGQMVKISGRKLERGIAKFFSHLRDSDECDYKTTTGKTKKEINRQKYGRCNEGERHKQLKVQIASLLEKTSGISKVRTEVTINGNHPFLKWRRPDVLANFMGQDIVFELQLSTTFISVITERDLFYRLNQIFIIWIFNFDEQEQHVNLNNIMTKDIFYNNKLNIFIFDKSAQEESEKRGELVLKCNWLKPDGSWQYQNKNSSDELGGKFVTLSELTYDTTYKLYYFDAEQEYLNAHPEFKLKTLDIEEENKKIISELDSLQKQEQETLATEDKSKSLVEAFELNTVKITKKHIIGKKDEKYGLITFDGETKIPFDYECLNSRVGWYEGVNNGLFDLFDKYDYTLLNTKIRRIEDFSPIGAKYVKEINGNLLWGIMNKKGIPLTATCYSKLDIWSPDKVLGVRDGLYCIIDIQGNEILNNYDYISELNSNNIADVIYDRQNGNIDSNCQLIKTEEKKLGNGLMKVCKVGKWGIEREDGTPIVSCQYDEIGSYQNKIVELSGVKFSIIEEEFNTSCPVTVNYVTQNDRKMLIFKVGQREAFMNFRQQQKAERLGLQPKNMTEMFFSFVNPERELLYLSAVPTKCQNKQGIVNNIPLGAIYKGNVVNKNPYGIIIKTTDGQTTFLHISVLGEYKLDDFENRQQVTIKKVGYNELRRKHIWKITSIS